MRYSYLPKLAAALFALAIPASAATQFTTMRPHEERMPSPLLQQPAVKNAGIDGLLASCLVRFAFGDLEAAEKSCNEVLERDPNRADALKLRGYVYLLGRKFDRASADFLAGMRLKPADDQFHGGYAQTLNDMGRFTEAAEQFRKAARLAPQKAAYWNGICWTEAGAGRNLKAAMDACNKAVQLEPDAASPYNSRGLVRLRMRQFPQAIADYKHSLDLSPDQSTALFGLGLAKLSAGNAAGALDIGEARHIEPSIDRIFISMGLLPEQCGSRKKVTCPRGFPAQPLSPKANHLIVRAPDTVRRELLRMAGLYGR
jgi:tetratricopeptide (TPR) repeat protein